MSCLSGGGKPWRLVHIDISGDSCWALTTWYETYSSQAVVATLAALWLWMWGLRTYQDESQDEQAACSPSLFPFLMECRITEWWPGACQLGGGCSPLPALGVSPCSSCCLASSIRGLEGRLSVFWSLVCRRDKHAQKSKHRCAYTHFNLAFSLDRGQAEDTLPE